MAPRDNAVLARLDDVGFARLAPFLELVRLKRGQSLFEAGQPVRYLYFPVGAVVGLRCELDTGEAADVGVLDRLLCGPLHALAGGMAATSGLVRHAGLCYRLPLSVFRSEMRHNDSLFELAMWTLRNTILLMSVASVCLRKHPVENLVAAWLLISKKGTRSRVLQVTHRDIAQSLGVRREAVTMTLNKYSAHGLIEQTRGHVHLIDAEGLKRWTCNCYAQWYLCVRPSMPDPWSET